MKRGANLLVSIMFVAAGGAFLLGCPKKVSKNEATPQPKVSESVIATQPGSGAASAAELEAAAAKQRAEREAEEQRLAQLLASRGEDIPIKEAPSMEFVEPGVADKAVLRPVYFDYDKSNIKPENQPIIEKIAKWLANNAERQLLIEGHCDERGTDEYNLALGERRALAVRRYLIALGVAADRLHTISYGEEKPAVPGSSEEAWAKNRRAEFKISAP